ncbi:hypothetical protein FRC09_002753 [Ceratobasidium sp. 395]|nr:hypothetical protein FRC09_002753 [Ceratobasidium sp. 395]
MQVILEILSGKAPYGGKSGPATIYAIMSNKKVPSRADHPMAMIEEAQDEIWRLLERCWASDPNRRPTASRILDELKSIRTKYQPLLS